MTVPTWDELFERAVAFDATQGGISDALRARREGEGGGEGESENAERDGDVSNVHDGDGGASDPTASGGGARRGDRSTPPEASPARIVADADVLAADLLVGGGARRALDGVREHSWVTLVASDPLLDDAEAVVTDAADADLAADWRAKAEALRDAVDHRRGNHPALASAKAGGAMHVLSLDDRMLKPDVAATVRSRVETSVRHPEAFATLFDAESLYREVGEGEYPGPDRDPRA